MQGVYWIRNKINDKRYIGSTNNFERGWKVRQTALRKGKYHNEHLQRAWNKYGEENFIFEVVENVKSNRDDVFDREQYYLDTWWDTGLLYNMSRKAYIPYGEKIREKAASSLTEWHRTHEHPQGMLGKHHTEETRAKQSRVKQGEKNPFYGEHHTEEAITKIREANLGENNPMFGKTGKDTPCYGRTGEKHPMYGKHHTEEAIEKMRKAGGRSYPTFFNVKTFEIIPAGNNLKVKCQELGLGYAKMVDLKLKRTEQTKDGWRLARKENLC